MKNATFRAVANSLILGAVLGFLGGAWTAQATRTNRSVLANANQEDLTTRAILSRLSRIDDRCFDLEQQVSAKESKAVKSPAAHRASFQTP